MGCCEELKGWQIALIVIGSVCCCLLISVAIVLAVVLTIRFTNPCNDFDFFDDQNDGEVNNLVITSNGTVFGTLGRDGLGVWANPGMGFTSSPSQIFPLPAGTDETNDVALDDVNGLLFVLDADDGTGDLWVLDVNTGAIIVQATGETVPVSTGTFSGVSADNGLVVVSGGENPITVIEYDVTTGLLGNSAQLNFGRGTPDVFLLPGAGFPRFAVISSHFDGFPGSGADYGIAIIEIPQPPAVPIMRGSRIIEDTGFTRGTVLPSNWPTKTTQLPSGHIVVAHCEGISVFDISDRDNIVEIGSEDLSTSSIDIVSVGNTAYVVGSEPVSRVFELDLSDPTNPQQVFDMQLSGDATSVHVSALNPSSLVVVAAGSSGVFGLAQ